MLLRERQQIIICVAAGIMVGGCVLFRYLPLRRRIRAVEQAKVAQRLAIAKASAESAQLPTLKEQLLGLEKALGNYEANIPDHRDIGVFLHTIANLMNEHNLTDQLVQPGKEIEVKGLHCIPISVQGKGGLKQIFEFFSSLQLLNRLVRIEQVKLVNDGGFGGEVSMQAETIVYYRSEAGQG